MPIDVCFDCFDWVWGFETGEFRPKPDGFARCWGDDATMSAIMSMTEAHFSWTWCSGCGSTLGGDRWTVDVQYTS